PSRIWRIIRMQSKSNASETGIGPHQLTYGAKAFPIPRDVHNRGRTISRACVSSQITCRTQYACGRQNCPFPSPDRPGNVIQSPGRLAQRSSELLRRLEASTRIRGDRPIDDRSQGCRDVRRQLMRPRLDLAIVRVAQFAECSTENRIGTSRQMKQEHAETIDL